MPLQIKFGMMAKQRERDVKELEEVTIHIADHLVVFCDFQLQISLMHLVLTLLHYFFDTIPYRRRTMERTTRESNTHSQQQEARRRKNRDRTVD